MSYYGCLCPDTCCIYVGVNDTVYIFYLATDNKNFTTQTSPLALGIHFSLTDEGNAASMNDDIWGCDLLR